MDDENVENSSLGWALAERAPHITEGEEPKLFGFFQELVLTKKSIELIFGQCRF